MYVRRIGETVTVELYGDDCELLARVCREAAGAVDKEMPTIDALRAFFVAAAVLCRLHGFVNASPEVTAKMDALLNDMEGAA